MPKTRVLDKTCRI